MGLEAQTSLLRKSFQGEQVGKDAGEVETVLSSDQARTGRLCVCVMGRGSLRLLKKLNVLAPCPPHSGQMEKPLWQGEGRGLGGGAHCCPQALGALQALQAGGGLCSQWLHPPGHTHSIPGAPPGWSGIAGIPTEGTSSPWHSALGLSQPQGFSIWLSDPPRSHLPGPHLHPQGPPYIDLSQTAAPGDRENGLAKCSPQLPTGIPGPVPSFFPLRSGEMTFDCPWVPVFLLRPVLGEAEGGGSTPALFPPA